MRAARASEPQRAETFWEAVARLRREGRIPRVWKRADLKPHLHGQFSVHTINSVPSNQSMTRDGSVQGDYVRKGMVPMAWRLGGGAYELVDDPQDGGAALARRSGGLQRLSVMIERDVYRRALELAKERDQTVEHLAAEALALRVEQISTAPPFTMPVLARGEPIGDLSPAGLAPLLLDDDMRGAGL